MSLQEKRIPWSDRDMGEKFSMIMLIIVAALISIVTLWSFAVRATEGDGIAIAVLALWALVAVKAVVSWKRKNAR